MKRSLLCTVLLLLSACTPESDMQGVDPRDYYAAHPIKNNVTFQTETHLLTFAPGAGKPGKGEVNQLREAFFDRSLLSADSVEIQLSNADMRDAGRKASLVKMLKYMGYRNNNVKFAGTDLLRRDQAMINIRFAKLVPPDCPDWRMSSSHNYSNQSSANFGCATEVNLGQMVADPRDLIRGTGELPPVISERGDVAMKQYRTAGAAASASGAAAPAAGLPAASADAASASPPPQ